MEGGGKPARGSLSRLLHRSRRPTPSTAAQQSTRQKPNDGVATKPQDTSNARSVSHEGLQDVAEPTKLPLGHPEPATSAAPDVWTLAMDDLRASDPDLYNELSVVTPAAQFVDTRSQQTGDDQSYDSDVGSTPAGQALNEIQRMQSEKALLHKRSAKFRQLFEGTAKLLLSTKDVISSVAAANPYAAAAWTMISLTLPLFLASTEQNEMALEGLHFVSVIVVEYRWREKCYLSPDSARDFTDTLRKLYASVMEYEALLYVHMNKSALKRLTRNVLKQEDWASRLEELKKLDAFCRKVTDAIADARAYEWHKQEARWQQALLDQPRQELERSNLRKLYTGYESTKRIHPIPTTGTLQWFLQHDDFLSWRASQMSSFLWVTADPGCGKSVISKFLVDCKAELCSSADEDVVVCYYFFRKDYPEVASPAVALRALLHQLIVQQPKLYRYAAKDFEEKGDLFLNDLHVLWRIFTEAIEDSSIKKLICVVDGIDECEDTEPRQGCNDLVEKLNQLAKSFTLLEDASVKKIFVTSRPTTELERGFQETCSLYPNGHIHGEDYGEQLGAGINLVLQSEFARFAKKLSLDPRSKEILYDHLSSIPNQTYLWLRLTLEYLSSQEVLAVPDIPILVDRIPQSVEDAFEKLLQGCKDLERARRLLSLVLGAIVPLSPLELNIMMNIGPHYNFAGGLALWPTNKMESRIKNICGLFVRIIDNKVYLIHAKAREFLLAKSESQVMTNAVPPKPHEWKSSFNPSQSALILTEACIQFLSLADFQDKNLARDSWRMKNTPGLALFSYAARYWPNHCAHSGDDVSDDLYNSMTKKLLDTDSHAFYLWTEEFQAARQRSFIPKNGTGLMYAAYFGQEALVANMLKNRHDLNTQDEHGRSAIFFSVYAGHLKATRCLLEGGADLNTNDHLWQTPFLLAIQRGHLEIAQILIEFGADTSTIDAFGLGAEAYGGEEAAALVHKAKGQRSKADGTTGLSRLFEGLNLFNLGWRASDSVSTTTHISLEQMLEKIQLCMQQNWTEERWTASGRDALFYDKLMPRKNGLGAIHDDIRAGISAFKAGNERYEEARDLIANAFSRLSAVPPGIPPAFLLFVPRVVALVWTQLSNSLALAFLERTYESQYCQNGGTIQPYGEICKQLQILLSKPDLEARHVLYSMIESVIAGWKLIIREEDHVQVLHAQHVLWIVRGWFEPPQDLIDELQRLSENTDEEHGRLSIRSIQVLIDLTQNISRTGSAEDVKQLGKDIVLRVLGPASPSSAPAMMTPRMEEISDNPRMIHYLLEGLRFIREAHLQEGDYDAAENNFRKAIELSDLYGPHHIGTLQLRETFARWLISQGRLEEAKLFEDNQNLG